MTEAVCSWCQQGLGFELPPGVTAYDLRHAACEQAADKATLAIAEQNEIDRQTNLAHQRAQTPPALCNLCGESCLLGSHDEDCGLHAHVAGGYWSTPGNGDGALDDCTRYSFRICEFCLDWLFAAFRLPVRQTDYMTEEISREPWRPAAQRIAQDSWRQDPGPFHAESARRAALRLVLFWKLAP